MLKDVEKEEKNQIIDKRETYAEINKNKERTQE